MDMNAKKHGVTKLIQTVTKDFERRLAALEDKYTAILWDFCVTKGGDFGDQNYNELLDSLCLDPADRNKKGASNAFKERHDHAIPCCAITHETSGKNVKGSPRVQYIRFFETTLKRALEHIDRQQNLAMELVVDRFAGQNPAQD